MSIETYEELIHTNIVDKSIHDAKEEVINGAKPLEARSALAKLRRKHFG